MLIRSKQYKAFYIIAKRMLDLQVIYASIKVVIIFNKMYDLFIGRIHGFNVRNQTTFAK